MLLSFLFLFFVHFCVVVLLLFLLFAWLIGVIFLVSDHSVFCSLHALKIFLRFVFLLFLIYFVISFYS
eukprot:m.22871 g.22871  ORF g.22871 m.22871 type:complete len:68 (-) comp8386_c0_seq1:82-285(-)